MSIADIIVIVILIAVVFLVVRYLWRRKSNPCGGCHGCDRGNGFCPEHDIDDKCLICRQKNGKE